MTASQAKVEVFLMAFKSLSKRERDEFLASLIKDPRLREDLMDLAVCQARSKEKGRPLKEFLTELDRERRQS